MGNTFTTLTHTILAQKALEAFVAAFAPMRAFAQNYSAEAAQKGDKVKVLWVGAQSAAQSFAGTYTMQDSTAEGKDITIDKHEFVSWGLTDKELSTQPQLSLERFARQKGFQLAKKVFQDHLSLVTAANFGSDAISGAGGDVLTSSAANFDGDDVIDISTACDLDDWPEMDRSLILSPSYHAGIRKDLKSADGFGSDVVMRQGKVPSLDTFQQVFKTSLIPGNGENLVGFAAHPDAILSAIRYLRPQEDHNYQVAEPVTDADTGITLGFRAWYDPDTGTSKRVLECNYGYALGNSIAIKRIVSS